MALETGSKAEDSEVPPGRKARRSITATAVVQRAMRAF
ncbi:hypothetical protein J2747_002144 [Thermococcus stetteri]|nr:hypothetical protein [Thermococcus stetteri]